MLRFINSVLFVWFLCTAQALAGTIVVLGDSLSAAYGMEAKQGWVALLAQRLAEQGHAYQVVNASISGDTSAGARARLSKTLATHQPDILIVQLGGNDGLRGLPLAQMKNNIGAIIREAQDRQARVLLIGMHLPPNYGLRYTQRFHGVYRELAQAHGIKLVPFLLEGVATQDEFSQADRLHPTAAVQPVLLENVWPYLRDLL